MSVSTKKNWSHGKSELNLRISQPRRLLKGPIFLVIDQVHETWVSGFESAVEKWV